MTVSTCTSRRRGGRPRREEAERRILHLLDTAAAIFIRDGYAGASIDRIAAEAGVGKPTIYTRFENKANLLKCVIDHILQNRLVTIDNQIASRTAVGALKEQLANIIAISIEPPFLGLFRLFLTEASKFPEIFAAFYATTEQQSKQLLLKQLVRYPEFASTRLPHDEIAALLLGLAASVVMMASAQPQMLGSLSPVDEAERIVDVVLYGALMR